MIGITGGDRIENDFGSLIDKERTARGLSYERLAEETEKYGNGLSSSYIYRLVAGKKNGSNKYDPTTKTVKILMEALNLDIRDVLKSLGMEQYLKDLFYEGYSHPTELKELLLQANIIIQTDSGELRPSKRQKILMCNLLSNLYKVSLNGGFEDFSVKAVSYAEELSFLIKNEKYLIELEEGEVQLELNVEVMVENYGIKTEDILDDVKDIDVRALYESDLSIPLFLMGEDWICDRVENKIVVKEKVSKLRNAYRKK